MDVHPLFATRFSPLRFDPGWTITEDDVDLLLEAARWAPSAGNSQPWAYFTARRGEPEHERIVRHLAASSGRWAPGASLLIVTMAHRYIEDTDWAYSDFADYDLGQSVAHLTLQAHAMGLACRQFRAFDLDKLTADLGPDAGWHVVSMIAVGKAAEGPQPRERRSPDDLRSAPWSGSLGEGD
jgi:nitroreductase